MISLSGEYNFTSFHFTSSEKLMRYKNEIGKYKIASEIQDVKNRDKIVKEALIIDAKLKYVA